jgi:hypothetical protein
MTKLYVAEFTGLAPTGQSDSVLAFLYPPATQYVVSEASGEILTLGAITGGSLYTNAVYPNTPLTGGTGSGATANITVASGAVTAVAIVNSGIGYAVSDTLSATLPVGSGFAVSVATIAGLSSPVGNATQWLEMSADSVMSVAIGVGPVATTSDTRLSANERKVVAIPANSGYSISIIANT